MNSWYCTRCGSSGSTPGSCPCIANDAAGRIARTPCHVGGSSKDPEDAFVLYFEREANILLYLDNPKHVSIGPDVRAIARAIYRALKADAEGGE